MHDKVHRRPNARAAPMRRCRFVRRIHAACSYHVTVHALKQLWMHSSGDMGAGGRRPIRPRATALVPLSTRRELPLLPIPLLPCQPGTSLSNSFTGGCAPSVHTQQTHRERRRPVGASTVQHTVHEPSNTRPAAPWVRSRQRGRFRRRVRLQQRRRLLRNGAQAHGTRPGRHHTRRRGARSRRFQLFCRRQQLSIQHPLPRSSQAAVDAVSGQRGRQRAALRNLRLHARRGSGGSARGRGTAGLVI